MLFLTNELREFGETPAAAETKSTASISHSSLLNFLQQQK